MTSDPNGESVNTGVMVARLIATKAHDGQVDKAGEPYIDHPRRVAERLADASPYVQIVAWLHDVAEDTDLTLEVLSSIFSAPVPGALDAITHRPNEPRYDYYARVKANPIALQVKAADIADNTDPARLALLDHATADRLRAKYTQARHCLGLEEV